MAQNEQTSPDVASIAARLLSLDAEELINVLGTAHAEELVQDIKRVAASALTQTRDTSRPSDQVDSSLQPTIDTLTIGQINDHLLAFAISLQAEAQAAASTPQGIALSHIYGRHADMLIKAAQLVNDSQYRTLFNNATSNTNSHPERT